MCRANWGVVLLVMLATMSTATADPTLEIDADSIGYGTITLGGQVYDTLEFDVRLTALNGHFQTGQQEHDKLTGVGIGATLGSRNAYSSVHQAFEAYGPCNQTMAYFMWLEIGSDYLFTPVLASSTNSRAVYSLRGATCGMVTSGPLDPVADKVVHRMKFLLTGEDLPTEDDPITITLHSDTGRIDDEPYLLTSADSVACTVSNNGLVWPQASSSVNTVWGMGWGEYAQLGRGCSGNYALYYGSMGPLMVRDLENTTGHLTDVTQIEGGYWCAVALKSDGTVWTWGEDVTGELGQGTSTLAVQRVDQNAPPIHRTLPAQVMTDPTPGSEQYLENVVQIAAGYFTGGDAQFTPADGSHVVAIVSTDEEESSDNQVWAWGSNGAGQLGNGASVTVDHSATPVRVVAVGGSQNGYLEDIVEVTCGTMHVLARWDNGGVAAWGRNTHTQLGSQYATGESSDVPVVVEKLNDQSQRVPLSGIEAVAAGSMHSLALDSDGHVWSWGDNTLKQLGRSTTGNSSNVAALVVDGQDTPLTNVIAISAWHNTSLALREIVENNQVVGTEVLAWGSNLEGMLGIGPPGTTVYTSLVPVVVKEIGGDDPLAGVVAIVAGMPSLAILGGQDSGKAVIWPAGHFTPESFVVDAGCGRGWLAGPDGAAQMEGVLDAATGWNTLFVVSNAYSANPDPPVAETQFHLARVREYDVNEQEYQELDTPLIHCALKARSGEPFEEGEYKLEPYASGLDGELYPLGAPQAEVSGNGTWIYLVDDPYNDREDMDDAFTEGHCLIGQYSRIDETDETFSIALKMAEATYPTSYPDFVDVTSPEPDGVVYGTTPTIGWSGSADWLCIREGGGGDILYINHDLRDKNTCLVPGGVLQVDEGYELVICRGSDNSTFRSSATILPFHVEQALPGMTASLDYDSVYQNTPNTTADRHKVVLTVTATNLDPVKNYEVVIGENQATLVNFQVPATPISITGQTGITINVDVLGGRAGSTTPTPFGGPPFLLTVVLKESEGDDLATAELGLTLRRLGDIQGDLDIDAQDKQEVNFRLNALPNSPGITTRDLDLTGDGTVDAIDKQVMNQALNGQTIP